MKTISTATVDEVLLQAGLLTLEQLTAAQELAKQRDLSLLRVLAESGIIDDQELAKFLADYLQVPFVNLSERKLDQHILKELPPSIARKYHVVPLFLVDETLSVAVSDPFDVRAMEELEYHYNSRLRLVIAAFSDITAVLDRQFGVYSSIKNLVDSLEVNSLEELAAGTWRSADGVFQESSAAGPINRILYLILSHAVRERASDIHFEPMENGLAVRFRIDGVLQNVMSFPTQLSQSLVSSIKILSRMDISEKRLPQDGGFNVKLDSRVIDLRASSFPIMDGEKIVLRLLDRKGIKLGLEELGIMDETLAAFLAMIQHTYGIILVTGPTGSGKTTTLYSVLNRIKSVEKNIMTIEDPIEYHLDLVNQSQVNVKAGLTFARGLKHFLRQDPDIILVGEIRDIETAEIAFQAAMTGHLVLATLHTNDAPSSVVRLIEMGIDPFLVSSTIIGVLAQRLVRLNCPRCQEPYAPSSEELLWAGLPLPANERSLAEKNMAYSLAGLLSEDVKLAAIMPGGINAPAPEFVRGTGCKECKGTGFQGRIGIFELMQNSERVKDLIMAEQRITRKIRSVARAEGMVTLKEDGLRKAFQGLTSIGEVMRVAK